MAKKAKGISQKKEKPAKEPRITKKSLVIEGANKGMTVQEIADHSGATVNSVRWYLSKEGMQAAKTERPKKSKD